MIAGLYDIFEHWHREGSVWIISDPHFNDPDLIHAYEDRPSAEEQVKLINSKVGKNDTLIILGDVGEISFARQLKGYKILVMGNHDAGRSNYEAKVKSHKFDKDKFTKNEVYKKMTALYPGWKITITEGHSANCVPHEYWLATCDNCLFDEIYEGPLMISEKLILSHEPVNVDWVFNIHGHVHDRKHQNDDHHFNVCADVIGYKPINFNQWMKAGHLAPIQTIHRDTIDKATVKARKRGYKLGEKRV